MRILWHSNAPFIKSGYGQQTAIWASGLRALGHDVAIAGFAGAQHLALDWDGITVYPAGAENAVGMDALGYYYELHQADVVISLCDAWALSPRLMALMNTVCWTPVDHEPLGAGLRSFFDESGARPLAMSQYGQRLFREAGYGRCGYIPHGIPAGLFKPPADRDALRAQHGYGPGTFVVGINQANRSGLRKALPEQIGAFVRFHKRHPDSKLMLHMARDSAKGQDLPLLLHQLLDRSGITGNHEDIAFFPDSGAYAAGVIEMEDMPAVYGGLDVLMGCAMAGGFELPLIEAQACGVPVIATNGSAMTEVAGPHSWLVGGQDFWVEERHAGFWTMPFIHEIDAALEAAWQAREDGTIQARREASREHALQYDAGKILTEFWAPFLADLEAGLHPRARGRRILPGTRPRKIWSPVMFRDERDMLQMRIEETGDRVSCHVVVEAEMTHRGVPKPLHLRDNLGRFAAHPEITLVAAELDPDADPWVNEHAQRDAAWPVIDAGAGETDIVLICDVDEIPSRSLLARAAAGELPEVCSVRMRTFLYAVDWAVADQDALPPQCVVATAGYIRRNGGSLAAIRDKRGEYPVVTDGGWHFSWLGGPEAQRQKLETATCHTELVNTEEGRKIADGSRYRAAADGDGLRTVPAVVDCTWPAAIRDRRVPAEWFRPREGTGQRRQGGLSDVVVMTTAWKRPYYLEQTLASWERVRGLGEIRKFCICLGASARVADARQVIAEFAGRVTVPVEVWEDDGTKGPWRTLAEGGGKVFEDDGAGFIVIAEEDILVADDVLELLGWGRGKFADDPSVLLVNAHSRCAQGWDGPDVKDDPAADPALVRLAPYFNQWGWGTWRDRWEKVLIPDWDYDGTSGTPLQSGHDWNIALRTIRGYVAATPDASRTQHIGDLEAWAATAETLSWSKAASFREHREPVTFEVTA